MSNEKRRAIHLNSCLVHRDRAFKIINGTKFWKHFKIRKGGIQGAVVHFIFDTAHSSPPVKDIAAASWHNDKTLSQILEISPTSLQKVLQSLEKADVITRCRKDGKRYIAFSKCAIRYIEEQSGSYFSKPKPNNGLGAKSENSEKSKHSLSEGLSNTPINKHSLSEGFNKFRFSANTHSVRVLNPHSVGVGNTHSVGVCSLDRRIVSESLLNRVGGAENLEFLRTTLKIHDSPPKIYKGVNWVSFVERFVRPYSKGQGKNWTDSVFKAKNSEVKEFFHFFGAEVSVEAFLLLESKYEARDILTIFEKHSFTEVGIQAVANLAHERRKDDNHNQ